MSKQKQCLKFKLKDDYYMIFIPFYYVYSCFGLRTYNLKNGLAHPITKWNIVLGIFASFVIVISFYLTLLWSNFPSKTTQAIYYIQYLLDVTIFLLQPVINFYYKEINFKLLKTLQEIGKIVKGPGHTRLIAVFVWIFFVLITLYYVMFIWIRWTGDVHWTWPRVIIIITVVLFEMKVLHISMLMLYITLKLKDWKMMLMSYQKDETDEINHKLNQLKTTFNLILVAYSMTKKVCQVFVSNRI